MRRLSVEDYDDAATLPVMHMRGVLLAAGLLAVGCAVEEEGQSGPEVLARAEATAATTTVPPTEPPTTTTAPPLPPPSTAAPVTTAERLTLSRAFCNDLEAGSSPMAIWQGVKDQYTPEKFAGQAYVYATIDCPDQLRSNEALRFFLTNWGFDPDA